MKGTIVWKLRANQLMVGAVMTVIVSLLLLSPAATPEFSRQADGAQSAAILLDDTGWD
jgi:hypothetical protein